MEVAELPALAGPHGRTAASLLGPERLSGASRVHSAAGGLERQPPKARLAGCGAAKAAA